MLKKHSYTKLIAAFIFAVVVCAVSVLFMFGQNFAQAKSLHDGSDASDKVYNMSVGDSLVGIDKDLWVGEGANRHYAYTSNSFSYEYYPSTNRLDMLSGTVDKYFTYFDQSDKETMDTKGLISVNQIHNKMSLDEHSPELPLTYVEKITINFINCKDLKITKHNNPTERNSNDMTDYENAGIYADEELETTVTGNDRLDIYTNETLEYANVFGIVFFDKFNLKSTNSKFTLDIHNLAQHNPNSSNTFSYVSGIQTLGYEENGVLTVEDNVDINIHDLSSTAEYAFSSIDGIDVSQLHTAKATCINLYNFNLVSGADFAETSVHIFGINIETDLVSMGEININKNPGTEFNAKITQEEYFNETFAFVDGIRLHDMAKGAFSNSVYISSLKLEYNAGEMGGNKLSIGSYGLYATYDLVIEEGFSFTYNDTDTSEVKFNAPKTTETFAFSYGLNAQNSDDMYYTNANIYSRGSRIQGDMASSANSVGLFILGAAHFEKDTKVVSLTNTVDVPSLEATINTAIVCNSLILTGNSRIYADATASIEGFGIDANGVSFVSDDSILETISREGQPAINYEKDIPLQTRPGYRELVTFGKNINETEQSFTLDPKQYTQPNSYFKIENAEYIYNVSFDSQGGSEIADQSVHKGDLVIPPANPEKDGCEFAGWYKEKDCQNVWDFSIDTVSADTTLYAKWNVDPKPEDGAQDNSAQTGDNNYLLVAILGLAFGASLSVLITRKKLYNAR